VQYINRYEFYREVVNGERPIKEIFIALSHSLSSDDFDRLFDEFSNQLEENFDYYKNGETEKHGTGRDKMPLKIFKRVQLAVMILSLLAMGAIFNDDVFFHSMDFILKKELCSASLILN
jgi:hypothetical protein